MRRDKLVILLMVLGGCLMGGIAVLFHHSLSSRAIAWWGADDVELIRNAPRVDALKLAARDGDASGDGVTIEGVRYAVVERKDVAAAHGIDHIRHSLLEDAHFHWGEQPPNAGAENWQFGLAMSDGSRQLLVVFDRDGHVGRSDRDDRLTITDVATGWSEFFAEQFAGRREKLR